MVPKNRYEVPKLPSRCCEVITPMLIFGYIMLNCKRMAERRYRLSQAMQNTAARKDKALIDANRDKPDFGVLTWAVFVEEQLRQNRKN